MTTPTKRRVTTHDLISRPFTVGDHIAEVEARGRAPGLADDSIPEIPGEVFGNSDDPASKAGELDVDELEAQARALEDAPDAKALAIQAWHRAAIAHSAAGNHEGVKACIFHAEHLAGNRDFESSVARKPTAKDAGPDVYGDDDDDQPFDTGGNNRLGASPDLSGGEVFDDDQQGGV